MVERGVSRLVRVTEACTLGVEVYLVAALRWQCPEKMVGVEVVVPVLHVVGRVGWRERSIVSFCVPPGNALVAVSEVREVVWCGNA